MHYSLHLASNDNTQCIVAHLAAFKITLSFNYLAYGYLSLFGLVCWGLTTLSNIWDHIATVPTCCTSGSLTNVLPHRNVMAQTQDMTPHPFTVYRHRADLSLCYSLIWTFTLEYTTTHFNVWSDPLGKSIPDLPLTPANAQLYIMVW